MTTKAKHCNVTFYNRHFVVEFVTTDSIKGEIVSPYDTPGNFGFVVYDVGHVGISKEAFDQLKLVRRGRDSLGDLDIFRAGDKHVFCVIGGACGIFNAATVETSRDWAISDLTLESFQVIPNDVPEGAKNAIDNPSGDTDDDYE